MRIWRRKRGPVLTAGRGAHALLGFLLPLGARAAWGYSALGWACVVLLVSACAWEVATCWIAGPLRWAHRYGDVVDLASFAVGVGIAGLIGGL